MSNTFKPSGIATIGVEYHEYLTKLNGESLTIDVWDTAGNERYHSFGKMHFRDADCIILMYDVSSEGSVDHL